jgi:hypothetical protein
MKLMKIIQTIQNSRSFTAFTESPPLIIDIAFDSVISLAMENVPLKAAFLQKYTLDYSTKLFWLH